MKPVVVVLHGGGGADAGEMARRTGVQAIADREDFLVVYPYGVDGQWNDGRGKTFRGIGNNTDVDDVAFISAVIDELIKTGTADPRRIYVVGLSNGGMMAYRLGIALGDRLAAVAAIIANLPANLAGQTPVRPLPVLIMNGTADPMMPWDGGSVRVLGREYGQVLSTAETVRYWTNAAGLTRQPETRNLEDRSTADRPTVEVEVYRDSQGSTEVVLYRVVGGGHNLPGGRTPDRPWLLGPRNMDVNAMEEVWAFFRKHTHEPPAQPPMAAPSGQAWSVQIQQVGDPKVNYLNVEFTADGRYMVWFEGRDDASNNGVVWHCGVDPVTGDLIPPDGRGFRAFESTTWARANPGYDADGPYYVGSDRNGRLVMVRPRSHDEGQIKRLPTPPDRRRRAIYPTTLPDRHGGYVFFIQNESTPGAGVRMNGNSWVELQYIDLAKPEAVHAIERQNTPRRGFAPMDTGFARWMKGRALLTYGAMAENGRIEVRGFDSDHPERGVHDLILDGHHKIDPFGMRSGDAEYILAGIDSTATSHVYRRPADQHVPSPFSLWKKIAPDQSRLAKPSLAQSHEPCTFQGGIYTVYQVNEQGAGFFDTTFRKPGELWLAELGAEPVRQWRVAPADSSPVAEPEPLVLNDRVLIFYNQPRTDDAEPADRGGGSRFGLRGRSGLRGGTP
ncbi:MAG: alpha/beta hydrolase family esterase, partial [Phycisphaerales bacterium]